MIVLKPFNTHNRRFLKGAKVSAEDDLAPLSFAHLKARAFIGGEVEDRVPAKVSIPAKAE
jgi:hypothetical protein